jgi:predicted methyltransferase
MQRLNHLSPLQLASLGAYALFVTACGSSAPAPATAATSPTSATESKGETDAKLRASLAGPQRTDAERKRDAYRHPLETLEFFGLKEDMSVVELSPGGGWYTAVLAPVLRDHGKLEVAGGNANGDPNSEGTKHAQQLLERFQKMPQAFDKVHAIYFDKAKDFDLGAPESADMVLTFRNLHNWVEDGVVDKVLAASFKALKHGGTFGLEEHRANPGASTDPKTVGDTGYLPEDYVVKLVEGAGFKLAGKSEVNANPKDTKDHPKGVWTLPPNYALGETDHAKYEAIGESDRMTLKFTKP